MTESPIPQRIVAHFEACQENYSKAANTLLDQLHQHILKYGFHVHSLNGRMKSSTSLGDKVKVKGYERICQVTDLIGVRIIAYFQNEIALLAKMVEDSFDVDWKNSRSNAVAKGDRFGYQSVHYVVRLGAYEYEGETTPVSAEIQIRTVLQHAWAEIEHDLRYKNRVELTEDLERNFARLSAVLETADLGFVELRRHISDLATDLVPRHITPSTEELPLTESTLNKVLLESPLVSHLDQIIADATAGSVHYSSHVVGLLLARLQEIGIITTAQLESELQRRAADVIDLYKGQNKRWMEYLQAFPEKHGNNSSPKGSCITYLTFLLSGKTSLED